MLKPEISSLTVGRKGIEVGHLRELWKEKSAENLNSKYAKLDSCDVLQTLLNQIKPIDFRLSNEVSENVDLRTKHYIVGVIEELLKLAKSLDLGLCVRKEIVYIFNGEYWRPITHDEFKVFLGRVALAMGMPLVDAKHYLTQDHLHKQFFARGIEPAPPRSNDMVLINLRNGTYEIAGDGHTLREFNRADFLTYQLPFNFDKNAEAPLFQKFLDRVLPDKGLQLILAEYMGYVFAKQLKLDAFLVLYGTGANGKSVFFEIIKSLLGKENVSTFSLKNLNEEHNRALIMDKLLNYGSEINASIERDVFKALVSGEPIQARLKYQNSITMEDYARLCFNCNELPQEVEHTNGFFRRFLIVPFKEVIAEEEQDPELSRKIIDSELSGVFNWVLRGLDSLLTNKRFTQNEQVKQALTDYKLESDTVFLFLDDQGYKSSSEPLATLREFYVEYSHFCVSCGHHKVAIRKFAKRLRHHKINVERSGAGGKVCVFASADKKSL